MGAILKPETYRVWTVPRRASALLGCPPFHLRKRVRRLARLDRGPSLFRSVCHRFASGGGEFTLPPTTRADDAFPALIAAHRFREVSAIAFLPAALILRLRATGAAGGTPAPDTLDGRPRRFTGPCSAWIAASRRFRSATSKATICSIAMSDRNIRAQFYSIGKCLFHCVKANDGAERIRRLSDADRQGDLTPSTIAVPLDQESPSRL